MKKKEINLDEIKKLLIKNPSDVIGVEISKTPTAIPSIKNKDELSLAYTIFVYRKQDSKFFGKIEINLNNILTK